LSKKFYQKNSCAIYWCYESHDSEEEEKLECRSHEC
jgi:hypothetical protein